ncbi:Serine/threonine-protein kinase KIPK2 [Vitis vinifera]|uniref:non-specific serine/threonine protein kinase n=1 Tax=Vitis vinifera TaxID=29760 RepID=A0A438HUB2_VITVI|nr:Serine/threonine-protein kinase KIPK2 [Vitis vinifera]
MLPPDPTAEKEATSQEGPGDRGGAGGRAVNVVRWDARVPGPRDRIGGRARERGGLVDARHFHIRNAVRDDAVKGVDNELTLANIVARALEFPKEPWVPAAAKDLITQLLVKEPSRRMGATMGATAIKHHAFFNG